MNVGIYQQPDAAIGGAELVAAVMAQAARDRGHRAEIVHHHAADLSADRLGDVFRLDLTDVAFRRVPRPPRPRPWHPYVRIPPGARRTARWDCELTARYDLFVANVHFAPPHCFARAGVLNVLFPIHKPPFGRLWPAPPWYKWAHHHLRARLGARDWRARMAGYPTRLAISRYAADWAREYWEVDCDVLAPPVLTEQIDVPKANAIVSLARFDPGKQQDAMLRAFTADIGRRAPGWELVLVGTLADEPRCRDYFAGLQAAAAGYPVRLLPNATRDQVRAELGRARIFWHVMGLGVDWRAEPSRIEHFGIATVEAMAAGCVPVALDVGGSAEIVTPDTGVTCSDLPRMADAIVALAADPVGLACKAAAARKRAEQYAKGRFVTEFVGRVGL